MPAWHSSSGGWCSIDLSFTAHLSLVCSIGKLKNGFVRRNRGECIERRLRRSHQVETPRGRRCDRHIEHRVNEDELASGLRTEKERPIRDIDAQIIQDMVTNSVVLQLQIRVEQIESYQTGNSIGKKKKRLKLCSSGSSWTQRSNKQR